MLKNWRAKQEDIDAIAAARQEDPFAVLGPHLTDHGWVIRAFVPDALSVRAVTRAGRRSPNSDAARAISSRP